MAAGKKLWKILLKILACLVSIALLALAAASLILAKPAPEPSAAPAATPSVASGPALEIRDETELYRLVAAFPAPVMSFMSGSGMTARGVDLGRYRHQCRQLRADRHALLANGGCPADDPAEHLPG